MVASDIEDQVYAIINNIVISIFQQLDYRRCE